MARCLPLQCVFVVLFCLKNNNYDPVFSHEYFHMRFSVSSNSTKNITGNSTLCFYGTFLLWHLEPSSNLFSLQATMKNMYYSFSADGGDGVCHAPVALAAAPQNIQPAVVSGSYWRWAPGGQAWVCAWLCKGVLHECTSTLDFTPWQ